MRRPPWRLCVVAATLVVVACSSADPAVANYCATVARTEAAMATTDPAVKRPAMVERADAAPAELEADWATVVAVEAGDPTARRLAQARIDAFDAEHC